MINKIYKLKYSIVILLAFCMVGCQEKIGEIGDLNAPTNLALSANIAQDGSGIVSFDANADGAIVYHYYFGINENENPTLSSDGKITNVYRGSGDYTVRVLAFGPGGIASNTSTNINVNVVYEAPADLIQTLTGGSSRDWQWEKDVIGHLGVGPLEDADGNKVGDPIWYTAQPFEKESVGCLYEDVMTFSLDGSQVNFELKNFDVSYFNRGEVISALGTGDPNEDACYGFPSIGEVSVGFFQSESGLTNTSDVSFLLGNNSYLSYYIGTSTYEILSYTENVIYVRVIQTDDAGAQFAWYQRLKATDAVTVEPEIEYELVWEDDFLFNGAPNSDNWGYDLGTGNNGWGNGESQFYSDRPENVFVQNGFLQMIAKRENFNGSQFTSVRMKTQDKFEFTYGKVEIRAKLPTGGGTWPALWMLGANFTEVGWPETGEIDIMEHVGNNQDVVTCAIHTPSSFGNTQNKGSLTTEGVSSDFHIYEMEWTAESIKFFVDGNNYYTYSPEVKNSDTWPFDKDQFIIMNIAVGGSLGGAISPGFSASTMEVDYVKVFQEVQ